jgi:endoglucanase
MKKLVQKYVEAFGPSGSENEIRELLKQDLAPLADEIRVDALGNLIARKGKKSDDGLTVMLAAHMDEIGLMVTHVDEKGFVRFTTIGGVRAANCVGGRVRFMNGTPGLIYHEKLDTADRTPGIDQLYIDVGATGRNNCPVKTGDVAAFERPFVEMGDRWVSKALDDRIGVVILLEVLRRLERTPHSLNFVFSVQEEVGVRGATTAAYGLEPDLGIAVDVTMTGDTPKGIKMDVALGAGPAVKVRDSGMLADPRVVDWMVRTAKNIKIPYQLEILEAGSTDARAIQLSRGGAPAGCVSIPCRYVHSPSEMVSAVDVENSVRLMVELLENPIRLA